MKTKDVAIFFLYVLVGLYFLNFPFNYVKIPEGLSNFNNWIIFFGGILILFGAFNYLRIGGKNKVLSQ